METAAIATESAAEWYNMAGDSTFEEIGKGRYRCLESGHELKENEVDMYKNSKHCRISVIDHAISLQKPPFNLFTQNHISRSKLICKLTGDTINKTEKHVWMHINGKRFLKKLEEQEMGCVGEKETGDPSEKVGGKVEKEHEQKLNKKKKKNKKKNCPDSSVYHEEDDFWISRRGISRDFNGDSGMDLEDGPNGEEEQEMGCVGEKEMGDPSEKVGRKVEKEHEQKSNKKKKKNKKKNCPDSSVYHEEDDFWISRRGIRRDFNGDSGMDLEDGPNGEERKNVATTELSKRTKEDKIVGNFTLKKRKKSLN